MQRRLRAAVGPSYALGAIIPSPRGMQLLPKYWPGFPYSDLWQVYDVFLPMAYFSYRARGDAAVSRYVQRSIGIIRARTGDLLRDRNSLSLAYQEFQGVALAKCGQTRQECGNRGNLWQPIISE